MDSIKERKSVEFIEERAQLKVHLIVKKSTKLIKIDNSELFGQCWLGGAFWR